MGKSVAARHIGGGSDLVGAWCNGVDIGAAVDHARCAVAVGVVAVEQCAAERISIKELRR